MKSLLLATSAVVACLASAPASAAPIIFVPVGPNFVGAFGNQDPSGSNTDTYTFDLSSAGNLAGFVGSFGIKLFGTNLDFTSVTLNGNPFTVQSSGISELQTFNGNVFAGPQTLSVSYDNAQRFSSYGGSLIFSPAVSAVPEPATWAMMLLGFGAVGYSMRRRKVAYRLAQVA